MSWQILPISRFAEVVPIWQKLHHKFGATPLLDPIFVRHLIDSFANGREIVVFHEVDPKAIGIFSRRGRFHWQTFQPANAPVGVWMFEPDTNIEPILKSLQAALPGTAMLVGLSQIDPDNIPRPVPSKRLTTIDYINTARVEITGSYENYWTARSKNLKRNMIRQRNRLARESRAVRLEELSDPKQIAGAVAEYARLESAGWKEEVASAVHLDDPQGKFYTNMLSEFAELNEAVIFRYFYDDQLVACDLCLLRDKILIILKTTHDEGQKGTSPAHLMRHEVIEGAFNSGDIERIEFYGPTQDWHLRWTDDVRVMYHLNYYRSPLVSFLHGVARKAKTS